MGPFRDGPNGSDVFADVDRQWSMGAIGGFRHRRCCAAAASIGMMAAGLLAVLGLGMDLEPQGEPVGLEICSSPDREIRAGCRVPVAPSPWQFHPLQGPLPSPPGDGNGLALPLPHLRGPA